MSLEQAINENTKAVYALIAAMSSTGAQSQPQNPVNTQAAAPAAAPQQQMPALPTFAQAPVAPPAFAIPAAPVAPACPITTVQDLFTYTTQAYQQMGAEKGARIQGVLGELGVANLNDVKPEQFPAFHAKVEALKTAG